MWSPFLLDVCGLILHVHTHSSPPPPSPPSKSPDVTYTGALAAHDQLLSWLQEQCVPLVREITFANGEVRRTDSYTV